MRTPKITKTKMHLIKNIQEWQKENFGIGLSKKVLRQVKLHNLIYEKELKKIILDQEEKYPGITEDKAKKKPKIKIKVDWESLEQKIGEIMEQWRKKQAELVTNQILEEIKLGLKKGENIILRNYFSLAIMVSKGRKGVNPSIVKKLKSPNLSVQEKAKLEAKKEVKIPSQKRVRFKISPQLKKEINQ